MENNKNLMNKLAKYLEKHCINHAAFARKIDTTPANIGSIIRGKSMPGLRIAYQIEKHTKGYVKMTDWLKEIDDEEDEDEE